MGPSKLAGNWPAKRQKRARAEADSRFYLLLPCAIAKTFRCFGLRRIIWGFHTTFLSTTVTGTCKTAEADLRCTPTA